MVDVGSKAATLRIAIATALVRLAPRTLAAIRAAEIGKGDVLEVARLAGIMAAKQTDQADSAVPLTATGKCCGTI